LIHEKYERHEINHTLAAQKSNEMTERRSITQAWLHLPGAVS
jgi:hypothetical protein